MVEEALSAHGAPLYVRKQIVHNQHVVRMFERRGVRFVDSEQEVPPGSVCIFSAHGVSPEVHAGAAARGLRVIDATCPLVLKVHQQARRDVRNGRLLILIGHKGHEETEGTRGEEPERSIVVETVADVARLDLPPETPLAYLTQTTLSMDDTAEVLAALRARYSDLSGPPSSTICYASQNRQNGVKSLARRADLVLVVGAENSSNSLRMVDVARGAGVPAYLVPEADHLRDAWLDGVRTVGVSSGASTPEVLVDGLLSSLRERGFEHLDVDVTAKEDVVFTTPRRRPGGDRPRDADHQHARA
jgi:4-hydroxy-3-methylbut-2-enyl diphosphate reductase